AAPAKRQAFPPLLFRCSALCSAPLFITRRTAHAPTTITPPTPPALLCSLAPIHPPPTTSS
uniref:Uncharacterized protein n=1 Tax=Aegilops tauschii subsp. strangulata TaxID=200361 RepID=A0A453DHN0_AEGTS